MLILTGLQDIVAVPESALVIAKARPKAWLVALPNCGHNMLNERGDDIKRLILKLTDILQADYVNSEAGKSAENLRHAFGSGPMDSFNFEAMSHLLNQASPRGHLPKRRRQRISSLITTLRTQRFFPMSAVELGLPESAARREAPYSFAFDSCSGALKAYRERLPKAVELARAVAIAGLEVKGKY